MLMGEYIHSLDSKGRLIIPSKLRDQLGDDFVVSKGLDGCLFAFPNSEWQRFEAKLRALPLTDTKARKFSRFLLGGADTVELDKQGRALIPQSLREHAKLEKDVVLCGVGNRMEIWDLARWQETSSYDDMDEVAEHMAELGI